MQPKAVVTAAVSMIFVLGIFEFSLQQYVDYLTSEKLK